MKELLKDSEATYVQLHRVDNGVDVAPEVTLSHGRLSQNADAYEAVLARAEEIERNVQGICEEHGGKPRPGERAAPEVDAFFAAGRWVPSAAVGKACGVRQNFVSGEDILDQRLNEPFNRVEINGKERTKDAQGVVRLLHTEVLNNELKVMGTLHPETVTRYKAVRVSLDRGHRFALAEFQSGQFFFVHPMAEATTGDLVVQAERDDGFLASFPAAGQSLPFRIDRDERALVRRLYEDFREAYEARNESGVMACLGDDWAADDGTTLQDLEDNLRRTFRAFDEVRCDLKVKDIAVDGGGRYRVSYDIILASRQFQRGLKHEEKSNVEEEVTVSPRGAPKITRTLSGRFWYIK
jgi:hypothetical protein